MCRLGCEFCQSLKFFRGPEPRDHPPGDQPRRRALNAKPAGKRFGLCDGRDGSSIGKGGMQTFKVDPRSHCVPIDHCLIADVFAEDKMGFKERFAQRGERLRLMAPGPFGRRQGSS